MARVARKKAPSVSGQLRMEVDRIVTAPPRAAPPPAPVMPVVAPVLSRYIEERERPAFGGWLVRQPKGDNEMLAMLIGGAKADPAFPKGANPDGVRNYLGKRGADGDVFEAIDDAERAWLRS